MNLMNNFIFIFEQNCLDEQGKNMAGMKVLISGSGNVAQFAAEKCLDYGAIVLSFSGKIDFMASINI